MSFSATFIHRPVATTLADGGNCAGGRRCVSFAAGFALPQVDFPTISVGRILPGASPEIMASAVAAPLEKQFGHIAGVTEMTSSSLLGSTGITLQFDLSRNIDGAARDVQAAINAARSLFAGQPAEQPDVAQSQSGRRPDHDHRADFGIYTRGQMYDIASSVMQQRLSQVDGVGQVIVGGSSLPAVRVEVNPGADWSIAG